MGGSSPAMSEHISKKQILSIYLLTESNQVAFQSERVPVGLRGAHKTGFCWVLLEASQDLERLLACTTLRASAEIKRVLYFKEDILRHTHPAIEEIQLPPRPKTSPPTHHLPDGTQTQILPASASF